ncbi:MAG: 16S rRNA (adenine(1518)-N(6)/adenine(1519)-N(6))-dimethyltransferase, partial [Clostridia bacterium]|nr:16S rRNA (adenine(1518)-N(6)/adenine(1519)-N(6))-dimethyltransferase [Clostridia bacterium]
TTPVLMKFIEQGKRVKGLTLTVQKEVAERLSAKAGTSDYGAITVAVDLVGEASISEIIPRTKFTPEPNVDSAVVNVKIDRNKFAVSSVELFREVVRVAFGNRRKTLCNNLMSSFKLTRESAEELITACGVNVNARGETLSAASFVTLTDLIYGKGLYKKEKENGKKNNNRK